MTANAMSEKRPARQARTVDVLDSMRKGSTTNARTPMI